jgi:hypothetical protein
VVGHPREHLEDRHSRGLARALIELLIDRRTYPIHRAQGSRNRDNEGTNTKFSPEDWVNTIQRYRVVAVGEVEPLRVSQRGSQRRESRLTEMVQHLPKTNLISRFILRIKRSQIGLRLRSDVGEDDWKGIRRKHE